MKNKMRKISFPKKYFFSVFLFCFAICVNAKTNPSVKADPALTANVHQWLQNNSGLRFLENKGQMADMNHKKDNDLLFEVNGKGMNVYITTSGISYVFTDIEKHKKKKILNNKMSTNAKFKFMDDSVTLKYCRADMDLVGAIISKKNILKEGESDDYENYYLSQCPQGVLNVRSYEKITIKNIYPGIDWVLFTNAASGLKYNFVVHRGADASQIKLKYKWTDKPELQSDGSIKINTPMGKITEGTPLSYTNENEQNKIETHYKIQNNEISFNINNYNKNNTLIIDPVLVWATYYGGNVTGEPFDIQSDGTNVYVTGIAVTVGFPTYNPGAGAYFQINFPISIYYNPFILQFNTLGVLKWATYYGGSGQDGNPTDETWSISSDGQNVWVTGQTGSKDFPVYNPGGGAYFQGVIGDTSGSNAFILKFNTNGVRKWATFYGGHNVTNGLSISSDGTNVWVTGTTNSSNLPTYNPGGGAFFQGILGKNGTVFILQFNTSGVRKWATYYGGTNGNSGDAGISICSDGTNVWVTGAVSSTDFPLFNPGGGAYFQGTISTGTGIPFILQFNTFGVRKWATFYGGNTPAIYGDVGNSISSDGTNVWVTGTTDSPNFPTFNPGGGAYFQGTIGINNNLFILQFNTIGVRKWATYYGGSNDDEGYSISSDGSNVWVTGETSSPDFPLFNSVSCNSYFQGTFSTGNQDVFLLQFSTTGVRKWATFYGTDIENDGCYVNSDGTNVWLTADSHNSTGYPTINPGGGTYFESTCNAQDNLLLAQFKIINPTINATAFPDSICLGDSSILKANGGTNYSWHPSTGLNNTNDSIVIAKPLITTVYTVVGTNSCGDIDSAKVTVYVKNCNVILPQNSVQIPNVITPNNDGKNDAFFIENLPNKSKLEIFNRWGKSVYESFNYPNNWEAENVVSGTYYYLLTLPNGTVKKGFLEIIK